VKPPIEDFLATVMALSRTAYPSKSTKSRRMRLTALAAVWSQDGRPVAFMSRTPSECEKRYSAPEKETTAVIETVRKWLHFLKGRHFTIVTDQEAVSFMFSVYFIIVTRIHSALICSKLQVYDVMVEYNN